MEISIDNTKLYIDLYTAQKYNNITVIPIYTNSSLNKDILTLKKGLSLGLVEISECNPSTVEKILVKNNSIVPLILVDGEEVVGAKQNRIINTTLLLPPKTTKEVAVSCTEQGRWEYNSYGNKFVQSKYFANSDTRRGKSMALYENLSCQHTVWDSIHNLEIATSSKSPTSALNDTYESINHDRTLSQFKCLDGQSGLIVIINNEIIGLELFVSSWLYSDFHDKIIRSYLIDNFNNVDSNIINEYNSLKSTISVLDPNFNIKYNINDFLADISFSNFKKESNVGLGDTIKFSNMYGTGSSLVYEDNIIYLNYFKKKEFSHFNYFNFDLEQPKVNVNRL